MTFIKKGLLLAFIFYVGVAIATAQSSRARAPYIARPREQTGPEGPSPRDLHSLDNIDLKQRDHTTSDDGNIEPLIARHESENGLNIYDPTVTRRALDEDANHYDGEVIMYAREGDHWFMIDPINARAMDEEGNVFDLPRDGSDIATIGYEDAEDFARNEGNPTFANSEAEEDLTRDLTLSVPVEDAKVEIARDETASPASTSNEGVIARDPIAVDGDLAASRNPIRRALELINRHYSHTQCFVAVMTLSLGNDGGCGHHPKPPSHLSLGQTRSAPLQPRDARDETSIAPRHYSHTQCFVAVMTLSLGNDGGCGHHPKPPSHLSLGQSRAAPLQPRAVLLQNRALEIFKRKYSHIQCFTAVMTLSLGNDGGCGHHPRPPSHLSIPEVRAQPLQPRGLIGLPPIEEQEEEEERAEQSFSKRGFIGLPPIEEEEEEERGAAVDSLALGDKREFSSDQQVPDSSERSLQEAPAATTEVVLVYRDKLYQGASCIAAGIGLGLVKSWNRGCKTGDPRVHRKRELSVDTTLLLSEDNIPAKRAVAVVEVRASSPEANSAQVAHNTAHKNSCVKALAFFGLSKSRNSSCLGRRDVVNSPLETTDVQQRAIEGEKSPTLFGRDEHLART